MGKVETEDRSVSLARVFAAGVSAAACTVAGCAGGSSHGSSRADADAARSTVVTYVSAVRHRDGRRACAQLAPKLAAKVPKILRHAYPNLADKPCEKAILGFSRSYGPPFRTPSVKRIRVSGDTA